MCLGLEYLLTQKSALDPSDFLTLIFLNQKSFWDQDNSTFCFLYFQISWLHLTPTCNLVKLIFIQMKQCPGLTEAFHPSLILPSIEPYKNFQMLVVTKIRFSGPESE